MLPDKTIALHRALDDAGLEHVFGGALAFAYHAQPRGTLDIDLTVFTPQSSFTEVRKILGDLGADPPADADEPTPPIAGHRFMWNGTPVDIFIPYDEAFFASVHDRVELHLFLDTAGAAFQLPFLSAEDLTIFKILFNRDKDWVDIAAILRHRPLDIDYVRTWMLHLKGDGAWIAYRRFERLCASIPASPISAAAPQRDPRRGR